MSSSGLGRGQDAVWDDSWGGQCSQIPRLSAKLAGWLAPGAEETCPGEGINISLSLGPTCSSKQQDDILQECTTARLEELQGCKTARLQ